MVCLLYLFNPIVPHLLPSFKKKTYGKRMRNIHILKTIIQYLEEFICIHMKWFTQDYIGP